MEQISYKGKTPTEVAEISAMIADSKNTEGKESKGGYISIVNKISEEASSKKSKLSAPTLLVYAVIKSRMNTETRISHVTNLEIMKYAEVTDKRSVPKYTKELVKSGYFKKDKRGFNPNPNSYNVYNEYTFPKEIEDKYQIYTRLFLDNENISAKTKGFILLLQPHIYGDREMTLDYNGFTKAEICKTIGWGDVRVKNAIDELTEKGYWRTEGHKNYIDLNKLHLDGMESIMKENISITEELAIERRKSANLQRQLDKLKKANQNNNASRSK